MGYFPSHSSTICLILNLQTGFVSPHYHLVHDDCFRTVSNALSYSLPSNLSDQLISTGYKREVYDISDAVATWPASESSNFWEKSRRKLHVSNQHSDKEADSKDDSEKSCPEREIVPSPEGEEKLQVLRENKTV